MSAAEVQEIKAYINDFFWEGYSIAGVVHEGVAKKVEALEKKLDALATSGPTGTGPTAAEIADELAKRLET